MSTAFYATLSSQTREVLAELAINDDEDLAGVHIPALLAAGISWGQVHKILTHLAGSGLTATFDGPDETWDDDRWRTFVDSLVKIGILTWEEVAVCVLGELNPPQVGTSQASNPNIQRHYPPQRTMQAVMDWFYGMDGTCSVCGSRMHIEVDHIKGKDEFLQEGLDPADADTLDNLQLLCRRCNVIKRESHKLGGLSFATAQAALMWILLVERPKTLPEFATRCRAHGLTMASVRFQEAWAMAIWLSKSAMYDLGEPVEQAAAGAVEEAAEVDPG
jgi:hypothetical protein